VSASSSLAYSAGARLAFNQLRSEMVPTFAALSPAPE
jgi:hypothetical protein